MDRDIHIRGRLGLVYGPIGLSNWPNILKNGPYLSLWDVLSLGTFCPLGRFVPGTFCPQDALSLGTFCPSGRFVLWDICPLGRFVLWDVLSYGTFCPMGRFVLGRVDLIF